MPYNTTPITPSQEITGQVALPLARVKKIIDADEDVQACSKNASFAIAMATEMFIQHLATQTHTVVKTEKKPRRNIQYRDVANAVARIDNLEFLADVVPKTLPYKKVKELKAAKDAAAESTAKPNGQTTIAASGLLNGVNGVPEAAEGQNGHVEVEEKVNEPQEGATERMEVDEEEEMHARDDDPAAMQLEMEMRGPRSNGASPPQPSGNGFTSINGR